MEEPQALTYRNTGAILCPRDETAHTDTARVGRPERPVIAYVVAVGPVGEAHDPDQELVVRSG